MTDAGRVLQLPSCWRRNVSRRSRKTCPSVGVEVELVLVPERRLVVIGEEERLRLDPLRTEPLGEQLGVRFQGVRVADGDERGRERGGDVVSDRSGCEGGIVEEVALARRKRRFTASSNASACASPPGSASACCSESVIPAFASLRSSCTAATAWRCA